MKLVLDVDYGPFWLPPEQTLWLLDREGTDPLFDYGPIEESPFAERAVMGCIEDPEKDFAVHLTDRWATWNWYMVETEERIMLDYSTAVSIGHHRNLEPLVDCAENNDMPEMAVVEIPDDKQFEIVQRTWKEEAVRLNTAELIKPEG